MICKNCRNEDCTWHGHSDHISDGCLGFERMTNADRFRAKTDQELAKTFEDFGVCPPHPCPYSDTDKPLTRDDCLECHLEWLKAEAEE